MEVELTRVEGNGTRGGQPGEEHRSANGAYGHMWGTQSLPPGGGRWRLEGLGRHSACMTRPASKRQCLHRGVWGQGSNGPRGQEGR